MTSSSTTTIQRKLRYGMIGGGAGAFIGAVHRMALALDGLTEFTAGALSSDPDRALDSGRALHLADDRNYPDWQTMLEREMARDPADRIDFVCIVTPNVSHFEIARAFTEAGFHVVVDKPMVMTEQQADDLTDAVERAGTIFAVTYNYTGYPLIKHAAHLVRSGELGPVRKVFVEYHQGWLAGPLENTGQKQAAWRTDPAQAGGGAIGDIGSHAENLLSTITGLAIESLCADLHTFVPGRKLDDDGSILLRLSSGARAVLTCSQVCIGRENDLSIRVHCEHGSLHWRQEHPNHMELVRADEPAQTITRSGPALSDAASRATRLPAGHPEAFIEAFANIYRSVIEAIHHHRAGTTPTGLATEYPTVHDGARGVRFITRAQQSSAAGATWVTI